MATTFLGIDVSDKSISELQHAVDTLKLRDLSNESIKLVEKFPEEMRKGWIDNPDSVGGFTDDIVKTLYDSLGKTEVSSIPFENDQDMQAIVYSEHMSNVIHRLDKEAYDKACGSYETPIDRQAWHYNYFHDALKSKAGNLLPNDVLDTMSEYVATGKYDIMREKYIELNIDVKNPNNKSVFNDSSYDALTKPNPPSYENKANSLGRGLNSPNGAVYRTLVPVGTVESEIVEGGKFIVSQPASDNSMDYGTYLQSKVVDMADAIGDELGLPDNNNQTLFISQSIRTGIHGNDGSAFVVIFTDVPLSEESIVKKAIMNEIRDVNPNDTVLLSDAMPVTADEVGSAIHKYSNESLGLNVSGKSNTYTLPPCVTRDIEHAKKVLDRFDPGQSQYNEDGFDSTGHSADGDYNPMYDSAYTENGPDF